jgi:outer membrane murein-binding lipoprotein Lpp
MKQIRPMLAAVAATTLLVGGCVGEYYLVALTPETYTTLEVLP